MKIAFITTNWSFSGPILAELQEHHEVRIYSHTKNQLNNTVNLLNLINWCNVAYFDFIHWPLGWVTKMQSMDTPIVTRMDGLDILSHGTVNWNNVDALVLMPVQEQRLARLRKWHTDQGGKELPPLPERILRRNIGIDLELFKPDYDRPPGYEIVFHANVVRATKQVYPALELFHELINKDDRPWRLTFIGQWIGGWNWNYRVEYVMVCRELLTQLGFPNERCRLFPNFNREGWAKFIPSMDLFWNMSYREGFPAAMGEACASGVYPILNWWSEAELLYPEKHLCRSPGEVIERTMAWGDLVDEEKLEERKKIRHHIEKYDIRETSKLIRELIEEVNACR